jgi:carboxypeptidase family protein
MTFKSPLNRKFTFVVLTIILLTFPFTNDLNSLRLGQAVPSVSIAVAAGQTGNLTIVVSGVAKPIQGATVTLLSGPSGSTLPGPTLTDINGTVTFAGLVAGTYYYRVEANGYSTLENSVAVTAGQNNQSLVTLQFENASGGSSIVLYYVLGAILALAIVLYLLRKRIWKRKSGTWGEEEYFQ